MVGLPVDLVCVPGVEGVGTVDRGVAAVVPVQNTLPVVVGLNVAQVGTDELVIDLVLDIGKKNESSDNTLTAARLDLAGDLTVPDVVVVGKESTNSLLRHGHEQVTVLNLGETAVGPVGIGSVTQVLGVQDSVVEVVPLVAPVLTNGHGGARFDIERSLGVATTQTECASTTLTIFCDYSYQRLVDCRETFNGAERLNSREQQGLSLGHWLLALQEAAAQAVADKANREAAKRTIVQDYVIYCLRYVGGLCAF